MYNSEYPAETCAYVDVDENLHGGIAGVRMIFQHKLHPQSLQKIQQKRKRS